MSITWTSHFTDTKDWEWCTPDLGHGWEAHVTDCSQSGLLVTNTFYKAAAVCKHWIVILPKTFSTFAEAKSQALSLALLQHRASPNPDCIVVKESQ